MNRFVGFCISVLNIFTVTSGQLCTFQCDTCERNTHYVINASTGLCERNLDVGARWFLLGQSLCHLTGDAILDETTCRETSRDWSSQEYSEPVVSIFGKGSFAVLTPLWNPSKGCRLSGEPAPWLGWGQELPVKTHLCLDSFNPRYFLSLPLAGFVFGIFLSFAGYHCKCKAFTETHMDDKHRRRRLKLGAKVMAADLLVKGGGARRFCLLYRILQVVANANVAPCILIFINGCIVGPLYVLLYVLPALRVSGMVVFRSHVYLVCPPDVSLFGIDSVQPNLWLTYLFHAIRPYLMLSLSCLVAYIVSSLTDEDGDTWAWNPMGFFRAALLDDWGPLILEVTILGTAVGTVAYSIATFMLVFSARHDERSGPISLVQDKDKCDRVKKLADFIIEGAFEIENTGEGLSRRKTAGAQETAKERFFDEDDGLLQQKVEELAPHQVQAQAQADVTMNVKPFNRLALYHHMGLGLVTLCSYAYKLFVFLRAGRLILAFCLATILGQALSIIVINGTIRRAWHSIGDSARHGVQTVDFWSLAHWNDTGAGVLYLAVTIYGLPLTGSRNWWNVLIAMALNTKAVYTLAHTLVTIVDMDALDVYKPDQGNRRVHCMWPFSICVPDDEEEDEDVAEESLHHFVHGHNNHRNHGKDDDEEDYDADDAL